MDESKINNYININTYIAVPTFCQRMTATVAHARFNCVCADTGVNTLVEYPQ